jgi:hypothetical protein
LHKNKEKKTNKKTTKNKIFEINYQREFALTWHDYRKNYYEKNDDK